MRSTWWSSNINFHYFKVALSHPLPILLWDRVLSSIQSLWSSHRTPICLSYARGSVNLKHIMWFPTCVNPLLPRNMHFSWKMSTPFYRVVQLCQPQKWPLSSIPTEICPDYMWSTTIFRKCARSLFDDKNSFPGAKMRGKIIQVSVTGSAPSLRTVTSWEWSLRTSYAFSTFREYVTMI